MPTTGSGKYPYPNSSAVPDVPADILLLAQRVAKISGSGIAPVADATERAALVTNGDAFEGLYVYQVDTKALYVYQSTAWVLQSTSPGMYPIIATSVAVGSGSGSVGAAGKIVFSGASTVSVNGCFTTTFDNYTIEAVWTHSTSTSTTMRLRASGSDNSASVYDLQTLTGNGASASAAQVLASSSWGLSGVNSDQENWTLSIQSPALAAATQGVSINRATQNPMTSSASFGQRMIQHRTASAYDGFSLIAGAGTISGTIRIYGLNNN